MLKIVEDVVANIKEDIKKELLKPRLADVMNEAVYRKQLRLHYYDSWGSEDIPGFAQWVVGDRSDDSYHNNYMIVEEDTTLDTTHTPELQHNSMRFKEEPCYTFTWSDEHMKHHIRVYKQ